MRRGLLDYDYQNVFERLWGCKYMDAPVSRSERDPAPVSLEKMLTKSQKTDTEELRRIFFKFRAILISALLLIASLLVRPLIITLPQFL